MDVVEAFLTPATDRERALLALFRELGEVQQIAVLDALWSTVTGRSGLLDDEEPA
jgi:hypothetical protein